MPSDFEISWRSIFDNWDSMTDVEREKALARLLRPRNTKHLLFKSACATASRGSMDLQALNKLTPDKQIAVRFVYVRSVVQQYRSDPANYNVWTNAVPDIWDELDGPTRIMMIRRLAASKECMDFRGGHSAVAFAMACRHIRFFANSELLMG